MPTARELVHISRGLRIFLILLALAAAGGASGIFLIGDRLSRPAAHAVGEPPSALRGETVRLPISGGGTVAGWFASGQPGAGAVLLLHGVRSDRRSMLGRALFLQEQGFAVLLIDLPAHGESTGERISFGARERLGVEAALAFLAQRLPQEKIGVVAVSLGAASLVLASPRPAPAAVVLESMYPTITEAVADRLALHVGLVARPLAPLLLAQMPLRLGISADDLRPIDHIARLGGPLLLISGDQDQHTSIEETQRLFIAAAEPKSLWIVPGAAHVDLQAHARADYEARVGTFLRQHLRSSR